MILRRIRSESVFGWIGLLLSGLLSLAALAIFIYILFKSGILPISNIIGQNKEFERGWALFFFLILGIPCLVLFMAGLVPWITWFHNRRKTKKEAVKPDL